MSTASTDSDVVVLTDAEPNAGGGAKDAAKGRANIVKTKFIIMIISCEKEDESKEGAKGIEEFVIRAACLLMQAQGQCFQY
mmetsp:Transcript_33048/g.98319  ORF Transcript_33048/g.98319 Transcript_33048/m.98319 type:complete len:81 (+) Transcript_33048:845-1087(+)